RDAVAGQIVDQRVVVPMRQIVVVLHADDVAYFAAFGDLRRRHVAQSNVTDQALALKVGEYSELRFDRAFGGAVHVEHAAKVDDIEHVEPEIAQVVVHRLREFLRGHGGKPRSVGASARADLSDDDEIVRIGMQRLADDLIGDVRAVEIAGVDVIDAGGDRFAQHGAGGLGVLGRSKYAGAGELHGAVAEPAHGAVGERIAAGFV